MSQPVVSRRNVATVMAAVFLVLFAWSALAFLVIRVDSDILAEAIQVQRWLTEPFLVLSYPGQLYGGVLEYPLIAVAESLVPGNVYALTAMRVFYVPIVGALGVYSAHMLFPRWRLWPFVVVAAAGPAVLHGMLAIKDLYPFSWVLAMVGVVLVFRSWRAKATWGLAFLGGVLLGLSIYQHPTTSMLAVPLVVAGIARWAPRLPSIAAVGFGFILGLVPLLVARFGSLTAYVAYTPSRTGTPDLVGAFGLTSTGWPTAVVPNGWGVQNTDLNSWAFPEAMQYLINGLIAAFVLGCLVVTIVLLARHRRGVTRSPLFIVSAMWAAAAIVLVAIVIVVPPVFFYGAALAVPVWITLVAAFHGVWGRVGSAASGVVVALALVTSIGVVLGWNPALPGAVGHKRVQAQEVRQIAKAIEEAGIPVVFGGYWETLPIAFASKGAVAPITVPVSRFPAPSNLAGDVLVAVPTGFTALPPGLDRWPNAVDAVGYVDAQCTRLDWDVAGEPHPVRVYECPAEALSR